jgi:hypothetical protein
MPSLADVFRVLDGMRTTQLVVDYAIGGATAVLFYAEPTRTYDLDVFIILPHGIDPLRPLAAIYEWSGANGYPSLGEHIVIHDVPVQFLPAHDSLLQEAVTTAREMDYQDIRTRVVDPEHLVALALQAGGARRRERAWQLLEAGQVDRKRLQMVLVKHGIDAKVPDDV